MSLYLVLDGPDGCGKSTQARGLCDRLSEDGYEVLHLREPGSTSVGEELRRILLDPDGEDLVPLTEVLLFSAARAQMIVSQVLPALEAGKIVVCERGFPSTLAYQALALRPVPNGLEAVIRQISEEAHREVTPDLMIFLDLPGEVGLQRAAVHGRLDRIEAKGEEYSQRVREAFLALSRDPWLFGLVGGQSRVVLLDGSQALEEVSNGVFAAVVPFLPKRRGGR